MSVDCPVSVILEGRECKVRESDGTVGAAVEFRVGAPSAGIQNSLPGIRRDRVRSGGRWPHE